jgi:acetolactate synthase regulatory subunit
MALSDPQSALIATVLQTAPAAIMQIIGFLRERGHEAAAGDLEAHLANSDANLRLVIQRSRAAQGLPPLPAVDPG